METQKQVAEDLKAALKSGDTALRDVLRMLSADLKNKTIELQKELSEEEVVAVVKRNLKARQDSIEQFIAGGRAQLAAKEEAEMKILEKYLPAQMSAEEIEQTVKTVWSEVDEATRKNFGLLMKAVMQKVGNSADGKKVSEAVKKILSA